MNRYKAFLIHFTLSFLVFLTVIALVIVVWYPDIFLETSGVSQALRMVVVVDLGLGPLITLILFRPGKPGLKFDIAVVVAVQIAALVYGVWVLYGQRPVAVVMHDGMFVCVSQQQAKYSGIDLGSLPQVHAGVKVALLPELTDEQQQIWAADQEKLPPDVPKHPVFVYGEDVLPYEGEALSRALDRYWDLSHELEVNPRSAAVWDAYRSRNTEAERYRYFVWTCGPSQFMVSVDPNTGQFHDALAISFINATQVRR